MQRSRSNVSHRDFPFYDGRPIFIGGLRWSVVLAGLVVACWLLLSGVLHVPAPWGMWLKALLFCGVPLLALRIAAGPAWTALFHRVGARDVGIMVGVAVLNIAVTLGVGTLLTDRFHVSANPAFQTIADADAGLRALQFAAMVPQLLGEELVTILPLLAGLWWLHARLGMSRRTALVLAWIGSAIPFALIHLPTYDWNLMQCLALIGTARLILSLAYLWSKNLWVSTGAHVLNDWALFGASLFLTTLQR